MAEIYLKRTLAGFVADDEAAAHSMRRIPVGTTVRCEIVKPRSLAQLRMYWAMCNLVASNHAELQTREQVDQALRLLTGHVDLVKVGDQVLKLPRSIAFAKLSQDEWAEYLSRAKDAVCEHLLPGVDGNEIQNEILRIAA
jgi:hypothetical protein